jgi:4-amino-4-deoxy-L-arabinose transferase-like glycosyltransferase
MKPGALSTLFTLPAAIGWRDRVIALLLGGAYVVWLLATARELGFPRDEGFYFHAATDYARWFDLLLTHPHEAMQRGAIDGFWGNNHEHPSLMKSLFAFAWMAQTKWHVFKDASTAFRFPAMCMSGLGVGLVYMFGARAFSRRAGAIAAILLATMPRVFFHAHLACFDVPIMTMWLASVYVYWRSQNERGWGWVLACGIVYGLTLETKHNAWILPAVFVPHALFVMARSMRRPADGVRRLKLPWNLVSMAVLGPLVFYALWPWLWTDTEARVRDYVGFHVHHEYYNLEFLHKNYFGPPSPPSYAPVMILATVPGITLLLFGIGAVDRLWVAVRRLGRFGKPGADADVLADAAETDLLLALAFAAPLAVFFLPATPIFGGTKHWFPAYPFLALFAGCGFDVTLAAMRARVAASAQRLAPWALGGAVIVAPLAITAHSHPFGLSTYVPLVGGTAGGADLGLNRQFWGHMTQSVGPWLAENAPRNATVFIHDTAWDSWQRMLEEGRVRRDLRGSGTPGDSQLSLVQHELHMNEVDHQIWVAYGRTAPAFVLTHDGVPIVSVYKKP